MPIVSGKWYARGVIGLQEKDKYRKEKRIKRKRNEGDVVPMYM